MRVILICVAALSLQACSATSSGMQSYNQGGGASLLGTLLGGGVGAFAGSQFGKGNGRLLSTAAGGIIGAYVGNKVATSSQSAALPPNQPTSYRPSYLNDTQAGAPSTCHPIIREITYEGRPVQITQEFCQFPDGTWRPK